MGCECSSRRNYDLNNNIQKSSLLNNNDNVNEKNNRKDSLSTENSEDERDLYNNINNQQNANLNNKNLVDNNKNNENNNNNFEEQKARNLVKFLLEDDASFYKNLIPIIDNLSSEDFKNLFEGIYDHNYSSTSNTQIKRLAHKFDNFYYILANCYKEKNFYEYLKELWIYYPYIEDLKNLKDEQKIMSKLSSTLPNYSSWPNNIQKDIIKAIKNTNLLSSDQIKKKIKDECVEIDKILKKLAKIIENFSSKDDDKDEEYFSKNDNLLVKDINTIYNSIFKNSKDKKKQLTKKDKENIIKSMNQEKKDFCNISPYLESNTCLIFDSVLFLALKQIGLQEELIPKPNSEIRNMFLEDNDNWYNDDNCDFFVFEKDEQKNDDKELKEWIKVAENFVICVNEGFQMFKTINLSKKIVNNNKNIYRIDLNKISAKFDEYQNSKRFYEKDPIKNLLIIKESITKINEI